MIKRKILHICVYIIAFLLIETKSYAAYPALVAKLQGAFESVQSWLLALATPAAGISIATGAFMKKFSFGDDEKIRSEVAHLRNNMYLCIENLKTNEIMRNKDDYNEDWNEDSHFDQYYEEETYNEYNGTYVQDVEDWSDQMIDDVLDGEPDAYWNID